MRIRHPTPTSSASATCMRASWMKGVPHGAGRHPRIPPSPPRHIAAMFALVYGGRADDHADAAARIVALESKLAAAHWDVVKRRDADLTYNLRRFSDLAEGA